MRVVIFTNAYKPAVSGVVTSIVLFRRGLIEGGHDVHIVAPEYRDFEDEEPYVFRLPALDLSDQLDLSLAMPLKAPIATALRGIKPAVIHSQHPILMGNLAAAFAQDLCVPLVFTFHTRYDEYAQQYVPIMPVWADKVSEEIVGRYLEKCAHVVAPTPSIRDLILRQYAPNIPVTVVPTPVDLDQYDGLDPQRIQTSLGLEDTEVLLYVGRLAGEKNLDLLLRAFARIVGVRAQARLLMVGDGPKAAGLGRTARDLGLGNKVVFTGAIPHSEVPDYAAAADVFVFSSLTETQGLVLIEAMAAGTPVVAVEAPSSVDVLTEGGGVLVPPQEEAFANAVLALLADRPRLRAIGKQAVRAARRYTVPAARECLLSVYEEAIAAGPNPKDKQRE